MVPLCHRKSSCFGNPANKNSVTQIQPRIDTNMRVKNATSQDKKLIGQRFILCVSLSHEVYISLVLSFFCLFSDVIVHLQRLCYKI